jgi:hypothetical protein
MAGMRPLGYSACEPHCNPVFPFMADGTHVACAQSERCQLGYDMQGNTFCQWPTGMLGQSATCVPAQTSCAARYDCVNTGTWKCAQYCRVGQSDCGGFTCFAFGMPQYDGNTEIGICQ